MYRVLEAACVAYASLNLSLLHYITSKDTIFTVFLSVIVAGRH